LRCELVVVTLAAAAAAADEEEGASVLSDFLRPARRGFFESVKDARRSSRSTLPVAEGETSQRRARAPRA